MRCLACGTIHGVDPHHWPRTRRYGDTTVPLCRSCHTVAHTARLTELLIERAPIYWRANGVWESAREEFERFMARREYHKATDERMRNERGRA